MLSWSGSSVRRTQDQNVSFSIVTTGLILSGALFSTSLTGDMSDRSLRHGDLARIQWNSKPHHSRRVNFCSMREGI
jgi:hypothetical protein